MKTCRLAKERVEVFGGLSHAEAPSKRSTRASSKLTATCRANNTVPDIEDSIPSFAPARKRRRITTTTVTDSNTTVKIGSIAKHQPERALKGSNHPIQFAPPSNWEKMYALVREMRKSGPAANAAVDTMGCERLADKDATPREKRFQTLVALMLSSQTKDTVNAEAMARLRAELPAHKDGTKPGLTLENMLAVDPKELDELIGKVGFHNKKTSYLKQTAEILRHKHNSDIPGTIEGMTSLPGVGPKMAHLCMSADNGWNRVEGIGVDVHVHRITNLWGWHATKTPEETRAALESWLPRDRWKEVNWLLVGLGQKICLPVGRKCGDCELGLKGLCKAAEKKKVMEGRERRMEESRDEDGKTIHHKRTGKKS